MADEKKSIIEVGKEWDRAPAHHCPHCRQELHLMLDAWKPDITQVIRSNCPKCGGEIYAGLFIVSDVSLRKVLEVIQTVIEQFEKAKGQVVTIDNPGGGRIIH